MDAKLFSPLQLRGVTLRNRIVLTPMLQYSAVGGHVNDWHLLHYPKFAAGGAGLVFVESTKVEARGCSTPSDLGLWKDDYIEPLRRIAGLVKRNGAVPGIQLAHAGRKARRSVPWEGRVPLAKVPGVDHGEEWELIGPSAVAHSENFSIPKEMTRTDIKQVIEAWGQAARRANEAGFEVVEIHGAHGYLIHQFLSTVANKRTDEYGGSLENRMRFAAEVVQSIRKFWPQEKPLFFRVSSVDEDGWKIEHSVALARLLKTHGVDVIDCSSGGLSNGASTENSSEYGYQVHYARQIRKEADINTMAIGLIVHADQADRIVAEGNSDLVGIGREFLHNPNWALDAAQKLGIESPFAQVPRAYGFWLDKRARSRFGVPSTWQRGLHAQAESDSK